jgi:hypothetical protein
MAAASDSASWPTAPRCGPGGGARLDHAYLLDNLASPACVRTADPALARQRCALEPYGDSCNKPCRGLPLAEALGSISRSG